MKSVALIEYQGRCDTEGNAVGHGPKVLREYYDLLKDRGRLTVYAPQTVLCSADREIRGNARILPQHIVMKSGNTLFEKIANKLRMFANIRGALIHADEEILWFFNVEFYLMLYLAFFGNRKRRIVLTMFQDGWHGGFPARIKQWIFERAQKRVECILSTGPDFRYKNTESVFMPDYPYEEALYAPYRTMEKKETAVCLGTMGAEKDIEGLVDSFTRNGYPLTVAGRFYDGERVKRLKERAGEKITIRDEYLEREEYLTLLAQASYCILPYSSRQYGTQTSGVLQEAMFLDTIPVAPEAVLTASGIPGLAVERLSELSAEMLRDHDRDAVLKEYRRLRENVYDAEQMRRSMVRIFC